MKVKKVKGQHRHYWKEVGRHFEKARSGPIAGWNVITYACQCGKTKEESYTVD